MQFPWSKNIKHKHTKTGEATIQVLLPLFGMQLCSVSFIWGLRLLNDLPWLRWDKSHASWALFFGRGWCIDSENCVMAKLESQFIKLQCHSPMRCINGKMTSFRPFWILNARISLLWNAFMSENLSPVFLVNSLISSKHLWAKKVITDGN